MRARYDFFILFIFAACVVHAQTSLKDVTGFGPCSQCVLLGNSQVLVPCSQMWRDLLNTCTTPQCTNQMSEVSNVVNINTCTNTPPPLPGGTSILSWPDPSHTSDSGMTTTTTTRTSNSATTTIAPASVTTPTSGTISQSSSATSTDTGSTRPTSSASAPTSTSTTNNAQTGSTAGAAIGAVPGWAEGLIFLAGWIFAL